MQPEEVKDTDPTIGKLITDVNRDLVDLLKKEIELAKAELKVSVTLGGVALGLFAGAAFIGLLSVIFLSVAIAYFIHWNGEGLGLQWAFLIVFGAYVALAALLALIGLRKVKKVKGPQRSIHQAQETRDVLTSRGS